MAVRGRHRNYVADTVDDLDGLSTEDSEGASCVVLTTPRSLYLFLDGVWELFAAGAVGAPRFTKTLSDLTEEVILPAEHGLAAINSVKILNPEGYAVEVLEKIVANALYLYSNISLNNHKLIII